jgi:pyruvate dehydrogenase E1 component alpha subunit
VKTNQAPDAKVFLPMYQVASLIKQCDDRFVELIKAGQIASPYYSPRGQEIIPAAFSTLLRRDDYVVTIYRGIHDQIAKGIPLKPFVAEFMGRATGTCKGKGGPMHITHPESGVMVTTGIVGSSMPIANGLALASQVRGDKRVSVAYFGDGASNIGAFHESLNLASVWKLPVVFVCQNNQYAEHTKFAVGTAVANVADRAASYTMPGVKVDGNEPLEVYAAARAAVDRARAGEGPTLIEAVTFRFHGHNVGDDDAYMDPGEKAAWMAKDPVPRYRAWLIAKGHASEGKLADMEAGIALEIDEAFAFALESPFPDVAELRRDVYADEVAP